MKKTPSLLIAFVLLMGIPTISSMERSAAEEDRINTIVKDLLHKPTPEEIKEEMRNNYQQVQKLILKKSKNARSCYKTILKWLQKGRDIEDTMEYLIVLPRKNPSLAKKIVRIAYMLTLELSPEQQEYFIEKLYENPTLIWNEPSPYQLATKHSTIRKFIADHKSEDVHEELIRIMAKRDPVYIKILFDNITNLSEFKKIVRTKEDAIDYCAWNQDGHTLLTCLYNPEQDEETIASIIEFFQSLPDFHKLVEPLYQTPSRLGLTPLHYAAYHGHLDVTKKLLVQSANTRVKSRKPPYFYRSEGTKKKVIDTFNEIKHPLEKYDGITPLHCAVMSKANTQSMISLLFTYEANNKLVDSSGKKAIDYLPKSDETKYNECRELLE